MNAVDECMAVGAHEATKADRVKWDRLPRVGLQEDGEGGYYELKNCPSCRSTMAVEVAR